MLRAAHPSLGCSILSQGLWPPAAAGQEAGEPKEVNVGGGGARWGYNATRIVGGRARVRRITRSAFFLRRRRAYISACHTQGEDMVGWCIPWWGCNGSQGEGGGGGGVCPCDQRSEAPTGGRQCTGLKSQLRAALGGMNSLLRNRSHCARARLWRGSRRAEGSSAMQTVVKRTAAGWTATFLLLCFCFFLLRSKHFPHRPFICALIPDT
jgi:hypothetical protein